MLYNGQSSRAGELIALGASLAFAIYVLVPEHELTSVQKLMTNIPCSKTVKKLKSKFNGRNLYRWVKRKFTTYDVYESDEEEERYWKAALAGQRELNASDAKYVRRSNPESSRPPLVMYYTPALPPIYRDHHRTRVPSDVYLPPRTICKWQRMMYPRYHHLRISDASRLRRSITLRDAKAIRRITKQEPDKIFFTDSNLPRRYQRSREYQHMWQEWQAEPHDPELVIVFE
ncbi:hypothetical protein BDQ17DRAFT_1372709 [Cyathus striatus]|nr:hypothetical protein BDQ17DRAFT_1372709 [Cyathus striatus]